MHEIPMMALIKQGVTVLFFLIFTGMFTWLYLVKPNKALEEHRFDILKEEV